MSIRTTSPTGEKLTLLFNEAILLFGKAGELEIDFLDISESKWTSIIIFSDDYLDLKERKSNVRIDNRTITITNYRWYAVEWLETNPHHRIHAPAGEIFYVKIRTVAQVATDCRYANIGIWQVIP